MYNQSSQHPVRKKYQHYSNPHNVLNENNEYFKWRAQQEVDITCF